MINQLTGAMRLMAALWVCAWATSAVLMGERQPASGSSARDSFLRVIDRPRVPPDAVVRARPEPEGLVAEEISFATEAGNRVPTLLFKRAPASARQPVVIVLHGTGGSK